MVLEGIENFKYSWKIDTPVSQGHFVVKTNKEIAVNISCMQIALITQNLFNDSFNMPVMRKKKIKWCFDGITLQFYTMLYTCAHAMNGKITFLSGVLGL